MSKGTIERSMEAQEKKKSEKIKPPTLSKDFLPYDINLNGRNMSLLFNKNTGEISMDDKVYRPVIESIGKDNIVIIGDHSYKISKSEGTIYLDGRPIEFTFIPSLPKLKRKTSGGSSVEQVNAPLPGIVVEILVKIGDKIEEGQKLLTLEAMKMQNEIISQSSGYIDRILVKSSDQVNTDDPLIVIKKHKTV